MRYATLFILLAQLLVISPPVRAQESLPASRTLELSTLILEEPCVAYLGQAYAARLLFEQRDSEYFLNVLEVTPLEAIPDDCSVIFSSGLDDNNALYRISNLKLTEQGIDTGLRYEIRSYISLDDQRDAFQISRIVELLVHDTIIEITGLEPVTVALPFDSPSGDDGPNYLWYGISKDFQGSVELDLDLMTATVTLDNENTAGIYHFSVTMPGPVFGFVDRRISYTVSYRKD